MRFPAEGVQRQMSCSRRSGSHPPSDARAKGVGPEQGQSIKFSVSVDVPATLRAGGVAVGGTR